MAKKVKTLSANQTVKQSEHIQNPDAAEPNKKPRKPLKKEAKFAIGVSIVAVLLVLIVALIVVAVQTANRVSQLYYTAFQSVSNEVIDEAFVGQIGGEYLLLKGDTPISDRYILLKFDKGAKGYLFRDEKGATGILETNGKERVKFDSDKPDLYLAAINGEFATVTEGGKFVTYDLKSGERVAALDGISGREQDAAPYYIADGDAYALVRRTAGKATITYGDFTVEETVSDSDEIALLASSENILVTIGQNKAVAYVSGKTYRGAYYTVQAALKNKNVWFCAVGDTLFAADLSVYEGKGGALTLRKNWLQSGTTVFDISSGKPENALDNAKLCGDEKTFVLYNGRATDVNGKTLVSDLSASAVAVGDMILDGGKVYALTGAVWCENAETLWQHEDVYYAVKTDGALVSPNQTLLSAADAGLYGAVTDSKQILKTKNGCVLSLANGYYFTSGAKYIAKTELSSEVVRLGDTDADLVAYVYQGALTVARIGKTDTTIEKVYAYYGVQLVTDPNFYLDEAFHGLIFRTHANQYGLLGENGKLLIRPQYQSITVMSGFTVVTQWGGGSSPIQMHAIADFNGTPQTEFFRGELTFLKDFVYIGDYNGAKEGKLFGAQGKSVLTGIFSINAMQAYRYNSGRLAVDDKVTYLRADTAQGVRVLRLMWQQTSLKGGFSAL